MSTLLLSQCDSLVAKVCENAIKQMNEVGANWADVSIVGIICLTIVIVALFAKRSIKDWHDKEIEGKGNKDNSPSNTPQNYAPIFAEKLLDYLKCQTIEYGDKGEFKKYKDINSVESKVYNNVITYLIDAQQNESKNIDIDNLRKALELQTYLKQENNEEKESKTTMAEV